MRLRLSEQEELLRSTFARFFEDESTPSRIRAAESRGFDPDLHAALAETGVLGLRVSEAGGGGGGSLLDAALVAEQAGRHLASVPLVEMVVALRLLEAVDSTEARSWLEAGLAGEKIITLDLRSGPSLSNAAVPNAAAADAVLGTSGGDLVLYARPPGASSGSVVPNLGSSAWGRPSDFDLEPTVLLAGPKAAMAFQSAREEWKVLMAAALAGLAREALEKAARYASERKQFGRAIGSFQGVAHPLADSAAEVEGARLMAWKAIAATAAGVERASALVSMAFYWSSRAATRAVASALHAHGGYGLSLEEDIQLYHRRAKAWPLVAGDPESELERVAQRLWGEGEGVCLPEAGEVDIEFGYGVEADRFADEAREFFRRNWTPELRERRHYAWEGYDPEFWKRLARAGFLYPAWPRVYGGQERGRPEMEALAAVFFEFGCTRHPIDTTGMVAASLMRFGQEDLKQEVLGRFARGEAISSLGYSEPGSGSDVADAQTRAVWDREGWVIDGQKMFTSGANLGDYVFLLARTDPEAEKHKGLTLFLVPLEMPGVEVRPFETLSDEKTNATYYSNVRLPDRYRVGEVNDGWTVLTHALELEHGKGVILEQQEMLRGAVEWARSSDAAGECPFDRESVRMRLARAAVHTEVADAINRAALYASTEGVGDGAIGPMAKFFSTDRFIEDAADLMDLCAPDSLLRGRYGGGDSGAAAVEFGYRLSTATSIYGGTSEIMKSIVAQGSLGMPRSRS